MGKINSFAEELEAARTGVGVFRAEGWGQIHVSGPDSPGFLHRMLSNEVQKLPVGEGRYNGLLDRKAMTLSLFFLRRLGEQEFLAVTPPQLREKTLSLLIKMKFIEKVAIGDVSAERGLLILIGPGTEALVKETPQGLVVWRDEAFAIPAWNVSGPRDAVDAFVRSLPPSAVPVGDAAVRLLRMESGFPEYGVDIDESRILLEAGLPFAYQRQKGCYPGQEVVERIIAYGKGRTPRRLCVLTAEGEWPSGLKKDTPVLAADGRQAGSVTSSAYDPQRHRTILLAYLDHKYAEGARVVGPAQDKNAVILAS